MHRRADIPVLGNADHGSARLLVECHRAWELLRTGMSARRLPILLALCCGLAVTSGRADSPAATMRGLAESPLYFEANLGQADTGAKFIARGRDCAMLISPTEAALLFEKSGQTRNVRLSLIGADARAEISGAGELPGRANYFIGSQSSEWRADVPLFSRVQLKEVYPGIDLIYYAGQSARLEYDFVLQPGANPNRISLRITGADKVRVDSEGNLVLKIGREEIRQHKPVIYQTVNGVRKEIEGGYRLANKTAAGFWIGQYDDALPLVIDPVLSFSSYLGGKFGENGWDIATDANGNVYICGDTFSPDLRTNVTSAAFKTNFSGTQGTKQYGDAFVAKFSPAPNDTLTLSYLTYLGGRGQEAALSVVADSDGSAYVTGFTDSPNFPTNSAAYSRISGRNNTANSIYRVDAFVAKLDPFGTNLIYSTYLGGGERDTGNAIAVNDGYAYVAGFTESTNFPVGNNLAFPITNFLAAATNVLQPKFRGVRDAFVTKVDTNGARFVYSTFLGGTNQESAQGIALDSSGNAYVTGYTLSTNFPASNGSRLNGLTNKQSLLYFDAFFSRISADGSSNLFSTYLGGENSEVGLRLALDSTNSAYITGYTFSTNFPVTTIITNTRTWTNGRTNFFSDVFVTKLSPQADGSYATNGGYSVVFGGRSADQAADIAVDSAGNAVIAGFSASYFVATNTTFTTNLSVITTNRIVSTNTFVGTTALDVSTSITNKFKRSTNNVFVAVLSADASRFNYAALFGGSGNDAARGVALDLARTNAYLVGGTTSSNFPSRFPLQARPGGKQNSNDVFIATIHFSASDPGGPAIQKRVASIGTSPSLFITQSNGVVTLTWPDGGPDFVLESNSSLSSEGWTTVQQEPLSSGGWRSVSLPATETSAFFRLRSP